MKRFAVLVDVDRAGGDDAVFTVRVHVYSPDAQAARREAERIAGVAYGEANVLGASNVTEQEQAS